MYQIGHKNYVPQVPEMRHKFEFLAFYVPEMRHKNYVRQVPQNEAQKWGTFEAQNRVQRLIC